MRYHPQLRTKQMNSERKVRPCHPLHLRQVVIPGHSSACFYKKRGGTRHPGGNTKHEIGVDAGMEPVAPLARCEIEPVNPCKIHSAANPEIELRIFPHTADYT